MKSLDEHKIEITKILKLKKDIPILYGEEAEIFYDGRYDIKRNSRSNGAFLNENLPPEYENTGVICMFKDSVGTLAHELMHAKQWEINYFWIRKNYFLKLLYKVMFYSQILYYYYPAEFKAFNFALKYLEKAKLIDPELENVYKDYRQEVRLKKWGLPFVVSVFLIVFWYVFNI